MIRHLASAVAVLVLLTGCTRKSEPAPAAPPAPAVRATPAAAVAEAPAAAEPEEGCGAHEGGAIKFPETRTRTENGATVVIAGAPLAGATTVALADLLARPAEFSGKTVRVEGNVSAMCMHSRSWFAVQETGREGTLVRVISNPQFLVPEGSMGKLARAEGVVEVIDVPAGAARHLAKDHKVGDPSAVPETGTVKSVVIRALGAEFI